MWTAPWTMIFPMLMMVLTLFCFNLLGDGLRDALDPKDRWAGRNPIYGNAGSQ